MTVTWTLRPAGRHRHRFSAADDQLVLPVLRPAPPRSESGGVIILESVLQRTMATRLPASCPARLAAQCRSKRCHWPDSSMLTQHPLSWAGKTRYGKKPASAMGLQETRGPFPAICRSGSPKDIRTDRRNRKQRIADPGAEGAQPPAASTPSPLRSESFCWTKSASTSSCPDRSPTRLMTCGVSCGAKREMKSTI